MEADKAKRFDVAAAIVVIVSAFLPWTGSGQPASFDLAASFLWDANAYRSTFSIGLVVLFVGVLALATALVARLVRYRPHVGALIALIAVMWQLQTFRGLAESYGDLLHPLRDMVQAEFAAGPWLAFSAGAALVLRNLGLPRWRRGAQSGSN